MDSKRVAPAIGFAIVVLGFASLALRQDPPRPVQPIWLARGAVLRAHPDDGCEDCPSWLIVTRGIQSTRLHSMNDFRGYVEIKSAEDALSYCRFGDNDPKYPHSGGVQHTEIVPVRTNDAQRARGSNVSKQTWDEAKMVAPEIIKQGVSWVVTRIAIVGDYHSAKPYLIKETIGKDGAYSLTLVKPFSVKLGKGDSFYFDGLG